MSLQQQSEDDGSKKSVDPIDVNKEFFNDFFKNNFSRLCLSCQYKYGFDLDLAKEVVHTAFIKLWETRYNLSSNFAVRSYIDKIITNTCLDIIKHEKVKLKHRNMVLANEASNLYTNEFHTSDIKQMTADINKAVAELPEQMRRIFELSRYGGLKYATIADQLGISVKTVETQMGRALQKLRQKLAQYLMLVFLLLW